MASGKQKWVSLDADALTVVQLRPPDEATKIEKTRGADVHAEAGRGIRHFAALFLTPHHQNACQQGHRHNQKSDLEELPAGDFDVVSPKGDEP